MHSDVSLRELIQQRARDVMMKHVEAQKAARVFTVISDRLQHLAESRWARGTLDRACAGSTVAFRVRCCLQHRVAEYDDVVDRAVTLALQTEEARQAATWYFSWHYGLSIMLGPLNRNCAHDTCMVFCRDPVEVVWSPVPLQQSAASTRSGAAVQVSGLIG